MATRCQHLPIEISKWNNLGGGEGTATINEQFHLSNACITNFHRHKHVNVILITQYVFKFMHIAYNT